MDLSGIISISGKAGLYTVVAQGKNSIIVESIMEKKRFPAYASDRISALEDISIYTHDGDVPLKDIFSEMYAKQDGKECLSHKEDISELRVYLREILPNFDEERVYSSDIKKIFQWYNIVLGTGKMVPTIDEESEQEAPSVADEEE